MAAIFEKNLTELAAVAYLRGIDNLVKENEDGKLSVDYISLLILKVSQLEKTVKELKEELNKR